MKPFSSDIETLGDDDLNRIAALEDVLRAFVDQHVRLDGRSTTYECKICGAFLLNPNSTRHAPNCPVNRARELLDEEREP